MLPLSYALEQHVGVCGVDQWCVIMILPLEAYISAININTQHCFPTYILLHPTVAMRELNPFTLRVPLESIVCYSHTYENNL